MLNLPRKLSKSQLLLQCRSPVLLQPRSFAVNTTNLKLVTHTSNLITTQSHSATLDSGNHAQMLSCYSAMTLMAKWFNEENQGRKNSLKKNINSEFQCNFFIDSISCCTSLWFSRVRSFLHFPNLQISQTMEGFWSIPFPTKTEKILNSSESWSLKHESFLLSNTEQNTHSNTMEGDRYRYRFRYRYTLYNVFELKKFLEDLVIGFLMFVSSCRNILLNKIMAYI